MNMNATNTSITVYVVQAEHREVPNVLIQVCATAEDANVLAADWVNKLLDHVGRRKHATAKNWEATLESLHSSDRSCNVWVMEAPFNAIETAIVAVERAP